MNIHSIVFLLFFGLAGASAATPPDDSGLTPASQFSAERTDSIRQIARSEWGDKRGLAAIELIRVVGCFKTMRPIKDFSDKDDVVWEVLILWSGADPSGLLWVNERTKRVIGLGLYDEQHELRSSAKVGS